MFYRCSEQTIYMRFFSCLKSLPHKQAQLFVDVDYRHQLALVAAVHEADREVIVGVGRYHVDPVTNYADCAFMVRDDWQDQGIGRYLVKRLIEVAQQYGVSGFTADVLMQNTRMMHIFHQCAPGKVESHIADNNYHLSFSLLEKEVEAV